MEYLKIIEEVSIIMKIKRNISLGISFFIILILLSTKLEAHHVGETITKNTSEGSIYTLTVFVDSTNTEIYANYTVFVELLIDQYGLETVRFSNIRIHAKLEGGAFSESKSLATSDIEFESTGTNAGFIFNISMTTATQLEVSGRAEFYENVTSSGLDVYTDSGWFAAHTVTVGAERTNFVSIFLVATALIAFTQIWRLFRRNRKL